ncbi:MAG: hypothetical protein NTU63_02095 [Candidatus Pacearchaeota archaeon]|nr:hypothetical protein [Candidatus Pacearchaeota archaeon]
MYPLNTASEEEKLRLGRILAEYAVQMNEAYKEQEKSVRSLKTVIIGNRKLVMPRSSLVNSL